MNEKAIIPTCVKLLNNCRIQNKNQRAEGGMMRSTESMQTISDI
jgi:hypothetical protein